MVSLETERLLLRAPVADDAEALAPMYADPEVMRYVGDGRPLARPATGRSAHRMTPRRGADLTLGEASDPALGGGRVRSLHDRAQGGRRRDRPRRPAGLERRHVG